MSRLKELRNMFSYTQDVVASHIGITRAAYTNLENGKRQCDAQTLLKLSELYSVTVGCILGVEPIEIIKENQPPAQGEELDAEILDLFKRLSDRNYQRAVDFAQGLLTAQEESTSAE